MPGESKECDADDHEGQMIPLTNGKDPGKEDFEGQRRK